MSIAYLRSILESGTNIVCLLGRAQAVSNGVEYYTEEFSFEVEARYGRSPEEIVSTTFYNNRPEVFYQFYRDAFLRHPGEPDVVNRTLKQMEDDGKLSGIVTRSHFGLCERAGCHNVIPLYGDIEHNRCPRCGRIYPASYVLEHTPIPLCETCGIMLHPGIALQGEMLDNRRMNQAVELISSAEILLIIGTDMNSHLGALAKYFSGDRVCLINDRDHYSDQAADCICIGNIEKILEAAYPLH